MDRPIHITSEIGILKTVLLHRPGDELENLTPECLDDLLFDDIPYLKRAQEEHDQFADALRGRGVEVLYLDQLATEALSSEELREQFVDEIIFLSKQGSRRVTDILKTFLLAVVHKRKLDGLHKSCFCQGPLKEGYPLGLPGVHP